MKIPPVPSDEAVGMPELMRERDVLKQWPLLSQGGLRAARASGAIAWVRGQRGSAWYRPEEVREYIKAHLERPRQAAVRSGGSTPASPLSLPPELVDSVAEASARRIMKRPPRPAR